MEAEPREAQRHPEVEEVERHRSATDLNTAPTSFPSGGWMSSDSTPPVQVALALASTTTSGTVAVQVRPFICGFRPIKVCFVNLYRKKKNTQITQIIFQTYERDSSLEWLKRIMARCFKMLKCPFKMYFHALELNFPLAQGQQSNNQNIKSHKDTIGRKLQHCISQGLN